jgi:hypothetical protein
LVLALVALLAQRFRLVRVSRSLDGPRVTESGALPSSTSGYR